MSEVDFSQTATDNTFHFFRMGAFGCIVWQHMHATTDERFVEHCDAFAAATDALGPAIAVLNYAETFVPTARQRRIVAEQGERMTRERLDRVAVVTSSMLVRGAVTTMQFLAPTNHLVRSFSPAAIAKATGWLQEITPFDMTAALAEIDRAKQLVHAVAEPRRSRHISSV